MFKKFALGNKRLRQSLESMVLLGLFLASLALLSFPAKADSCVGKFANPITDICWECIFPVTLSGATLYNPSSRKDDISPDSDASKPICTCGAPALKIGMPVSFWEPLRRVEVMREPYCMGALGGVDMNVSVPAPRSARSDHEDETTEAFFQVHWYVDPEVTVLKAILGDQCLDNESFDVGYITELDPLWADDELTDLLNPETILFANPVSLLACAADCVGSTVGSAAALDTLFWCGGCNGGLYPFNGHVQSYNHGVQGSSLLVERMAAKMHRQLLLWNATGKAAMCSIGIPQPIMQKSNYRFSMLYPIPETGGISTNFGTCCQPFGASTLIWGLGREYPYKGEDFIYEVYRKRDCCQGAFP